MRINDTFSIVVHKGTIETNLLSDDPSKFEIFDNKDDRFIQLFSIVSILRDRKASIEHKNTTIKNALRRCKITTNDIRDRLL